MITKLAELVECRHLYFIFRYELPDAFLVVQLGDACLIVFPDRPGLRILASAETLIVEDRLIEEIRSAIGLIAACILLVIPL